MCVSHDVQEAGSCMVYGIGLVTVLHSIVSFPDRLSSACIASSITHGSTVLCRYILNSVQYRLSYQTSVSSLLSLISSLLLEIDTMEVYVDGEKLDTIVSVVLASIISLIPKLQALLQYVYSPLVISGQLNVINSSLPPTLSPALPPSHCPRT